MRGRWFATQCLPDLRRGCPVAGPFALLSHAAHSRGCPTSGSYTVRDFLPAASRAVLARQSGRSAIFQYADQLGDGHGLDQVQVETCLPGAAAVFLLAVPGHRDDARLAAYLAPQATCHLVAIDDG